MTKLNQPACVELDGEQVMVDIDQHGQPTHKYRMRIREGTGLRPLTRDEELAFAAAPGTRAERDAAEQRAGDIDPGGRELVLIPEPWLPGEKEEVVAFLERYRHGTDTDDLH